MRTPEEQQERRRNSLERAFIRDLLSCPRFNGKETLEPVGLALRNVWARYYPKVAEELRNSPYKITENTSYQTPG